MVWLIAGFWLMIFGAAAAHSVRAQRRRADVDEYQGVARELRLTRTHASFTEPAFAGTRNGYHVAIEPRPRQAGEPYLWYQIRCSGALPPAITLRNEPSHAVRAGDGRGGDGDGGGRAQTGGDAARERAELHQPAHRAPLRRAPAREVSGRGDGCAHAGDGALRATRAQRRGSG
jgi:hypothetical protein